MIVDRSVLAGFAMGVLIGTISGAALILFFISVEPMVPLPVGSTDPACFGWGTMREFDPPSTYWYNENCGEQHLTDIEREYGNYVKSITLESCHCYESKKSKLLPWGRMP